MRGQRNADIVFEAGVAERTNLMYKISNTDTVLLVTVVGVDLHCFIVRKSQNRHTVQAMLRSLPGIPRQSMRDTEHSGDADENCTDNARLHK